MPTPMVSLKPLRILLASLICGGLCGLGWGQTHEAPEAASRELVISETAYDSMELFATLASESVSALAPATRADNVPYVFDLAASRVTVMPVVVIEPLVGVEIAEAQSAQGDCVKNKDPPSA
jgi:hypothetical protein